MNHVLYTLIVLFTSCIVLFTGCLVRALWGSNWEDLKNRIAPIIPNDEDDEHEPPRDKEEVSCGFAPHGGCI